MTKIKPRQSCMFRRRSQAADKLGRKRMWPSLEHPGSASQDDDGDDTDFSAPRKSRLGAPQLQAQLSRQTDRTRLRRLKNTLLSRGAWQQVTRIEELCHTHLSHKWLYHLDACAGSVLTPNEYITNVQNRLGNRNSEWVVGSVDAAVPSKTNSWNMQKPAAQPKPRGSTTRVFTLWFAA